MSDSEHRTPASDDRRGPRAESSAATSSGERRDASGGEVAQIDELLELAAFEVLGVLDPVDMARLHRGFDALAPAQQARLVALQESIARDPALRDVEPPPGSLRQFAIGRVKQAIEADVESPAPLAHIGPIAPVGRSETISRERIREIVHEVSRLQPPQSPQLVWRAASFVLLGALCVSLYMNWHHRAISEDLAAAVTSGAFDRDVGAIARDLAGFDFAGARHVELVAQQSGASARAGAFIDVATGRVAVYGVGFEPDSTIEIVLRGAEGAAIDSRKVRVASAGFGQIHEVGPAALANARIEVLDGDGRVLFRQA